MTDLWTRIKKFLADAVGIVLLALAGFLYYEKTQKDAAEAEVKNEEDKQKINTLTQDQVNNDSQMDDEAKKRAALEKQLEEQKNEQLDKDQILTIINEKTDDKK